LKLDIANDALWEDKTSILHLARIPLYLQLIITEYKVSRVLPDNKSKLLKTFVSLVMQREDSRNAALIDNFAKERLLGSFAYIAVRNGYSLRLAEYAAKPIISSQIKSLKEEGLISLDVVFGVIWREIFSNNFLKIVDSYYVEWLHQLIFVYFLGNEIIRLWIDKNERGELSAAISGHRTLGQSCAVALGLLDSANKIQFLEFLLPLNSELVQEAFEAQSDNDQRQISEDLISNIIGSGDEADRFHTVALNLPYFIIVEKFAENFRGSSKSTKANIANAISQMVIEYHQKIVESESPLGQLKTTEVQRKRFKLISHAISRAIDLLRAGTQNDNEFVRFYSIKGLWEHDRGLAAQTLGELYKNDSQQVKPLVKELMDEWGIYPYE
jgi:hypothetical protein